MKCRLLRRSQAPRLAIRPVRPFRIGLEEPPAGKGNGVPLQSIGCAARTAARSPGRCRGSVERGFFESPGGESPPRAQPPTPATYRHQDLPREAVRAPVGRGKGDLRIVIAAGRKPFRPGPPSLGHARFPGPPGPLRVAKTMGKWCQREGRGAPLSAPPGLKEHGGQRSWRT